MSCTIRRFMFCLALPVLAVTHISSAADSDALRLFVSIPPQAFLVDTLAGPEADVRVLVPAGQSPHTFEPSPRQVIALGRADAYFTIGLPFEDRLTRKIQGATERARIVDLGPATREHHHVAASAGHAHHDHHGATDPHTWLSPPLLKGMAVTVAETLTALRPGKADVYHQRLAALHADLDELHALIGRTLAPYRGQTFYVFHPAFGHFAEAYGLHQKAVEVSGKSPSPGQLTALIRQARRDGVRVIFVQPQFDRRSADTVARAIGGRVVPMDPLARDVLANLNAMAEHIRAALSAGAASPEGQP